ncbi:DUF4105 domain-containing protein [Polaribacter sp.]|jgi:hypothetical protein|uniref:lipoprotein N-acyltransferase Lnb domain-containing protein n=1 Tax=Polaribacter sp. TaxID=1920175 RepID=UPI0026093085|nr:DUF4105 domain-containing protein [Polaribacter sp.]MDG1402509.1 DUF4105 domain-containing protein [Polaribacter sp.]
MEFKKIITLLAIIVSCTVYAQLQLSEKSQVSILTIGPGYVLNDAFGHSAIRVKDPVYKFDIVFDYGRYDFESEGFYLRFVQGQLDYEVGQSEFDDFFNQYQYQQRSVKEQVLNLNSEQKTAFYLLLKENIKPDNKTYPYDFFYNNCATKIKEGIETTLDNPIVYYPSESFEQLSFRNLIRSDLNQNSWGSFGIDIALGSKIDQIATVEEHLFLPKYLYQLLENARIKTTDAPLVSETKYLNPSDTATYNSVLNSPLFVLSILALILLVITYNDYKNNTRTQWLDLGLFAATGFIGVFLLLLWFATDHTATAYNYNLLWACALNILFMPSLLKTRLNNRGISYIKFLLILLSLMGLHWLTGVQSFAIGLIPLLLGICIRYLFLIHHFKAANRG